MDNALHFNLKFNYLERFGFDIDSMFTRARGREDVEEQEKKVYLFEIRLHGIQWNWK